MLEDFLADLRGEGRAVAPGAFTLSTEQAVRQLSRRPYAAFPWLVSAILKSGATWLRIVTAPGGLTLEYDGLAPDRLEPNLADELTLGLLVAAQRGVSYRGGALKLEAGPDRWQASPCRPQPHQQIRLVTSRVHDGLYPWLERIRLCPIPVELNDQSWNQPDPGGDYLAIRSIPTAVLKLGGRSMFGRPSLPRLILVIGGISIRREPPWPEAHVIARPMGLRRNLEGDDVVEDDAYRRYLDELYAVLQAMARELERQGQLAPEVARLTSRITSHYLTSES